MKDSPEIISITTEYIQLGQLLKLVGMIGHGGEAKALLASIKVFVNDQLDQRRGRKLYPGDLVAIEGRVIEIKSL
jgi:ribosome-associated protein